MRASLRSVGMSQEHSCCSSALTTVRCATESQELTQLRISSCHQESQGSCREMSQLGEEARFKGVGRLGSVCGVCPLRLLRPCYAHRNSRNPLPCRGSGLPCYVVTPISR